jgi:NAD(P)-dependent dehydrogenase (short-subunit alcohol dehydrogenase family)
VDVDRVGDWEGTRMIELQGRNAIVTGGGGGIGRAIATAFARAGAGVAVVDIRDADARAVAADIVRAGGRAHAVQCDVADSGAIKAMVVEAVSALGSIDTLVNNAAIMDRASFLESDMAVFDRLIAVNVRGPFECSIEVGKVMAKRGGGVILHITSVEDERGVATSGVSYTTSKGAQKAMVASSAVHLAPMRIRVVGLAPGMVPSGLNENNPRGDRGRIIAGRPGTTEEIAAAALFLVSDHATYVNGTTLYVDGGWTATL